MAFREIENREEDLRVLRAFLENAGESLKTFRYFDKRELTIVGQHLLTVLSLENGIPVSYGHLDPEDNEVWLGICVSENAVGLGHGNKMMSYLIDYAKQQNIPEIHLKVDADNSRAKSLYDKFGFEVVEHSPNRCYIMRAVVQRPVEFR